MKKYKNGAMTQREQVIEVMEGLNGAATLLKLNQTVDFSGWKAKSPYANIRRIVQDDRYFFKIKPGLWGLNTHRKMLGHLIAENESTERKNQLDHYYYQGLLLEIGNMQNYQTFIPDQDKNKNFLGTTLGEVRNLEKIHSFSYQSTIDRARMVDVIWFNKRNMPYAAFEVEHSTDFTNALSKYIALQDFNTKFYVVAGQYKKRQFEEKISRDEYLPIKYRVTFIDHEKLASWHSHSVEVNRLGDLP